MKMGIQAENPLEWLMIWIAEKLNIIPLSMIHGAVWPIGSRVVFTALKLGIFEAAKDSPQTLEEIAQKTGLNPKSLTDMMIMLVNLGYFKYKDNKFVLTRNAAKFCLKDAPDSYYVSIRFAEIMANWMGHLEEYLKTGKGLNIHETMTDDEWHWYQLAMEFQAKATSKEAAKMTPVPPNPIEMLDIGGSHGLYSVELCKKYPSLKATILDLPEAIEKARPLLAKCNMGDRICYWPGNALTDDYGENKYDLILMSGLMHHFSADQNISVSQKAAKALNPGGYFIVHEFSKPELSKNMNTMANTVALYADIVFNISSTAGTFSQAEIVEFQKKAGLIPCGVNKFKAYPSYAQICAIKS
jgi:ubiquinone/menaquinone biosynthesis C-methylase UbiE